MRTQFTNHFPRLIVGSRPGAVRVQQNTGEDEGVPANAAAANTSNAADPAANFPAVAMARPIKAHPPGGRRRTIRTMIDKPQFVSRMPT